LYGIEVREYVAVTMVELRGELDLFSLDDLRKTLNRVLDSMKPTLVDLSGITFLDLESARELAVRSQLYARRLTLRNPSPQVEASIGGDPRSSGTPAMQAPVYGLPRSHLPGGSINKAFRYDGVSRAFHSLRKSSRSALIVSASVVGMPCGNPSYVFSVPFCRSCADSGAELA
jgi:anti-anti-sigma regulatory factor